jgi:hypothetical protein
MKSSIRIIKQKRDEDPKDLKPSESENPIERSTREMESTVKSWIGELQKRKRAQVHSFSHLPVTAIGPTNQNT